MSKKDEYLNTALILIYERGFKAMTMRELACAMDCEVANVYNYLDSKQSILKTYLFKRSQAFHEGIDQIEKSEYDPIEKIKSIVSLHVRISSSFPYESALLMNEWRHLEEPDLSKFIQERENYERKVKKIISNGMKTNYFKKFQRDIVTQTFLSTVRWIFTLYVQGGKKINPIELERQISEFILKGMIDTSKI